MPWMKKQTMQWTWIFNQNGLTLEPIKSFWAAHLSLLQMPLSSGRGRLLSYLRSSLFFPFSPNPKFGVFAAENGPSKVWAICCRDGCKARYDVFLIRNLSSKMRERPGARCVHLSGIDCSNSYMLKCAHAQIRTCSNSYMLKSLWSCAWEFLPLPILP